jgi:hypothetical protein
MGATPVHGHARLLRRPEVGLGGALVFITGVLIGRS